MVASMIAAVCPWVVMATLMSPPLDVSSMHQKSPRSPLRAPRLAAPHKSFLIKMSPVTALQPKETERATIFCHPLWTRLRQGVQGLSRDPILRATRDSPIRGNRFSTRSVTILRSRVKTRWSS